MAGIWKAKPKAQYVCNIAGFGTMVYPSLNGIWTGTVQSHPDIGLVGYDGRLVLDDGRVWNGRSIKE